MATSSALSTTNTYIKYKITVTENSTSTANNTSSVTVTVNFYRTNTGYTTYGSGTVYCTIDGTTYSASVTSSQKITSSGIDLFTKTLTISHDTDGSKSLTVSAYISHSQFSSSSQSFTTSLTTIARASSITSASAVTLGNACSIKWTPASSAFAYKLRFVVGSGSYTTGYISPGSTSAYTYSGYTMTIATWAPYITTATSATCTVTLYSYSSSSSSTAIGSSSTTFTVTVPSSVVPSVSIGSVAEGNSAVTLGAYVKGKSTAKVTFTGTSAYSSDLASYSLTVGSLTYTGTPTSGTAVTKTSGTLTSAGTIAIKVTVTDKRGRSASASTTITVYDYSSPSVTTFQAVRCDADGTEDTSGSYVKLTYAYSVSSVNSTNTASMTVKWKKSSASSYANTAVSSTSTSVSTTSTVLTSAFDTESSYSFQLTLTDAFSTTTKTVTVSTALFPIDVYRDGQGVAIGKVAESSELFDVAWDARVRGDLAVDGTATVSGDLTVDGAATFNSDAAVVGGLTVGGFAVPKIQYGTISITPSAANTPTSYTVTYAKEFPGAAYVAVTPGTALAGTDVLGLGVTNRSSTGCVIYMTSASTTARYVAYIAVYVE